MMGNSTGRPPMKKPKHDTYEIMVIMNGDEFELVSLPTVVMRVLRRLHAQNRELQGPPEPKQKRAYRKRDNGGDAAVVAEEGSP